MFDEFEDSAVSSSEAAVFGLGELGLGFGERETLARVNQPQPIGRLVQELARERFATEIELRRALLTGIWSGLLRLH
jgi:hypothetical protein